MEDRENIGFACKDHAPTTLRLRKVPNDIIGRHVKAGFKAVAPDGSTGTEHMWVKVQEVQGHTLMGYLDSDPVMDCGINYEDPVQVDIEDVEEIIPPLATNRRRKQKWQSRRSPSRKLSSKSA